MELIGCWSHHGNILVSIPALELEHQMKAAQLIAHIFHEIEMLKSFMVYQIEVDTAFFHNHRVALNKYKPMNILTSAPFYLSVYFYFLSIYRIRLFTFIGYKLVNRSAIDWKSSKVVQLNQMKIGIKNWWRNQQSLMIHCENFEAYLKSEPSSILRKTKAAVWPQTFSVLSFELVNF